VIDNLKVSKFPEILIYPFGKKAVNKFIKIESSDTFESIADDLLDYVEIKERLIDDINI